MFLFINKSIFAHFKKVMDSKKVGTQYLNKDSIQKNWFVADADGKTLGRFSSEIAKVLEKTKHPLPHLDCVITLLLLTQIILS